MKYLALVAACLLTLSLAPAAVADDPVPGDPVPGDLRLGLDNGAVGLRSIVPVHVEDPALQPGEVVRLEWSVSDLDRDEVLVVSGAAEWVIGDQRPRLGIPAGTLARHVRLDVRATLDSPERGALVGTATGDLWVDATAPELRTRISGDLLFPVRDGFLDHLEVEVADEYGLENVMIDLLDRGEVVASVYRGSPTENPYWIRGLVKRESLPSGTYTVRISGLDRVRNLATDRYRIRVDDRQRVLRTYHKTVPAARTVVDQYVGACSSLGPAAGRGWAGSLGLYSSPCRSDRGEIVLTVHGLRVPFSAGDPRRWITVSTYGGAARGEGSAYIVHGWFRAKDDKFIQRRQFNGRLRSHASWSVPPSEVLRNIDGKGMVYFQLGLTGGSRYDVKSFTIDYPYFALVSTRSRTASDAKTIALPSGAPGPGYTAPKTDAAEFEVAYKPAM